VAILMSNSLYAWQKTYLTLISMMSSNGGLDSLKIFNQKAINT